MDEDRSTVTPQGIAAPERHVYGLRPVSAFVPNLTRAAFRHRSAAAAQVMADWDIIVGSALARVTIPKRLSSGSLTLVCMGPLALELQHMSSELISRINAHVGKTAVKVIRFEHARVDPPEAFVPVLPATEVHANPAERALAGFPDGYLRTALAALGHSVLSPRPTAKNLSTTTKAKL